MNCCLFQFSNDSDYLFSITINDITAALCKKQHYARWRSNIMQGATLCKMKQHYTLSNIMQDDEATLCKKQHYARWRSNIMQQATLCKMKKQHYAGSSISFRGIKFPQPKAIIPKSCQRFINIEVREQNLICWWVFRKQQQNPHLVSN